ncbi:MAG: hypothetical protein JNL08_02670 [Planctomycetes bacterium]|nr:hypothetical protein [Planctomycetota bacterium]
MHCHRSRLLPAAAAAFLLATVGSGQCEPTWNGDPLAFLRGSVTATTLWDPDGAGPATLQLVVGGDLSFGQVQTASLARWDGSQWVLLSTPLGDVTALGTWNGQLVIGLDASVYLHDGSSTTPLGSLTNSTIGGSARCFATYNGELIVGGAFDTVLGTNTVAAAHIARWNGTAWAPLGTGLPGRANAAVVFNGGLHVAGDFGTGSAATNLRVWGGSIWVPLGTWDGPIDTLAVRIGTALTNSFLYAGGAFSVVNGSVQAPMVARYSPTSNSWTGTGTPGGGLASRCWRLFVRGTGLNSFEVVAGLVTTDTHKAWRLAGGTWSSLGSTGGSTADLPTAVSFLQGRYVMALEHISAATTPTVLQHDGAANLWQPALGRGIPGTVYAIAVDGAEQVIAGSFATISGVTVHNIARGQPDAWSPLGGGLTGGSVRALARLPNGDLVAGGDFQFADGQPANHIALWNGTAWSPLGTGTNGPVRALLPLPNGELLVGGQFQQAGATTALRLARWTGTQWLPVGGGTNGDVLALALLPDGSAAIGGAFTTANSGPASRIARWDGQNWSVLGGGLNQTVNALAVAPNGDLWAGGAFTAAGSSFANYVARWDGGTWHPTGAIVSDLDAPIHALAVLPDGDVVAGGFVSQLGIGIPPFSSTVSANVARLQGSTWSPLEVSGGVVWALSLRADGQLLVGGDFVAPGPSYQFTQRVPSCPATATVHGTGCAGANGPDVLTALSLPWNEASFRARATGLPAQAVAFTVYGFAPLQLPLPLVFPEALPGCDLLATPDVLGLAVPAAGVLDTQISIVPTPSLVGLTFFHQVVSIEIAGSTPIAVTATNALALAVGVL